MVKTKSVQKGVQMTHDEIMSKFDSEWILIKNPKNDKRLNVLGGEVVFHSPDRDSVYKKAKALKLKRGAFLYTGKIPDDMVVIL